MSHLFFSNHLRSHLHAFFVNFCLWVNTAIYVNQFDFGLGKACMLLNKISIAIIAQKLSGLNIILRLQFLL